MALWFIRWLLQMMQSGRKEPGKSGHFTGIMLWVQQILIMQEHSPYDKSQLLYLYLKHNILQIKSASQQSCILPTSPYLISSARVAPVMWNTFPAIFPECLPRTKWFQNRDAVIIIVWIQACLGSGLLTRVILNITRKSRHFHKIKALVSMGVTKQRVFVPHP